MKRVLLTGSAIALSASLFAGCAASEGKPSANGAGNNNQGKAKEVTLKIFNYKVEISEQLNKLKEEYEKSHPGVKLQLETVIGSDYDTALKTKFAAADMPDIFTNGGYQQLNVWKDHLEDLSDQPWVKDAYDFAKIPMTSDGKLYGMPANLEGYGFVYNKDLFAKANITKIPATLTELEETAKKLQAAGITPFVNMFQLQTTLGRQLLNVPFAQQPNPNDFIKGLNDGTAKFEGNAIIKEGIDLLDVMVKYGNKNQLTTDYNSLIATFGSGQAAMMQSGNWTYPLITKVDPKINVGIMPMPINDDAARNDKLYVDVPLNWVVNKNSKVKTEAKEFLNWLVTSETGQRYIAKEFQFIPAFKTVKPDAAAIGPLGEGINKYLAKEQVLGWHFNKFPDGGVQEFGTILQKYVGGKINREQLYKELQDGWSKLKK
ncbi:ABC transporter substrate-binding protein [Paenibacillus piri]|uniref:Extracellular solute-binding protein n=1 Tax=Paenibacillus piri TaxID=2547395 RepID=A0A4R5KWW3_9BACL|nr:extracellular solute-binding protein [Paenibacillus piri]TDF99470.1 extracellular solute-binding protein [Paenibacillus piri]